MATTCSAELYITKTISRCYRLLPNLIASANNLTHKGSRQKGELMNQAFTGWIEPKNQRPEKDKEVLVTYKYDSHIGLEIATMKYEPYKDSYYWKTENDFLDYLLDTEVLAWQPLPKPFMKGELK